MLPSVIEPRFLALLDQWLVSFEDINGLKTQLTDIFRQASIDYWGNLRSEWGRTGIVNDEIAPIIKTFSVSAPAGNVLDTSEASTDLPDYDTLGFAIPTFVVSGITYTGVATTYWNPNDRVSSYATPTVRYPKHDFTNDQINIYPASPTCTTVTGQYSRNYYLIDFDADTDVPIKEVNIQNIISRALVIAFKKLGDNGQFQLNQILEQQEKNNK